MPLRSWSRSIILASSLAGAVPVAAQSPVAIVEEIDSKSAGVEFMDYVFPGQVIRLEKTGTIVLSYLSSCWREKVVAGTVTIGHEQSDIKDGKVQRTRVHCSTGKMQLSSEQAKQSGGMSFRGIPKRAPGKDGDTNAVTIYGTSPLFELQRPGKLLIERIDKPGETIEEQIGSDRLVRGAFLDLARNNRALAPGGLYRVRHEGRQMLFRIAADAEPGAAPLTTRLVRLQKN